MVTVGARRGLRSRAASGPTLPSSPRCSAANSASALASEATVASGATTSTRRPSSSAVSAVFGPMHAMTVVACGLPAMPTRLRTVEDEVNTTASNPPPLMASRIGAGGGAARTVR